MKTLNDYIEHLEDMSGNKLSKDIFNVHDQNNVYLNIGLISLLWSLSLEAPAGEIGYEFEKYESQSLKPIMAFGIMDNINKIIKNNKAGKNGETLTWDEIIELYKGA